MGSKGTDTPSPTRHKAVTLSGPWITYGQLATGPVKRPTTISAEPKAGARYNSALAAAAGNGCRRPSATGSSTEPTRPTTDGRRKHAARPRTVVHDGHRSTTPTSSSTGTGPSTGEAAGHVRPSLLHDRLCEVTGLESKQPKARLARHPLDLS